MLESSGVAWSLQETGGAPAGGNERVQWYRNRDREAAHPCRRAASSKKWAARGTVTAGGQALETRRYHSGSTSTNSAGRGGGFTQLPCSSIGSGGFSQKDPAGGRAAGVRTSGGRWVGGHARAAGWAGDWTARPARAQEPGPSGGTLPATARHQLQLRSRLAVPGPEQQAPREAPRVYPPAACLASSGR